MKILTILVVGVISAYIGVTSALMVAINFVPKFVPINDTIGLNEPVNMSDRISYPIPQMGLQPANHQLQRAVQAR